MVDAHPRLAVIHETQWVPRWFERRVGLTPDGFVTPESVRELERQLKELGKTAEIIIYPDVDHGFFNNTRPEVYNEATAKDAWERVVKFFRKHLG